MPDGASRIVSGAPYTVLVGGAAVTLTSEQPEGSAEITNRINYAELPETGGSGPGLLYAAGAFLTLGFLIALMNKIRNSMAERAKKEETK